MSDKCFFIVQKQKGMRKGDGTVSIESEWLIDSIFHSMDNAKERVMKTGSGKPRTMDWHSEEDPLSSSLVSRYRVTMHCFDD